MQLSCSISQTMLMKTSMKLSSRCEARRYGFILRCARKVIAGRLAFVRCKKRKSPGICSAIFCVGVLGQQSVKSYRFLSNHNVRKTLKISALYNYIILTVIGLITPILNYHAKNTPKSLVRFYLFCTFANELKTNCYGSPMSQRCLPLVWQEKSPLLAGRAHLSLILIYYDGVGFYGSVGVVALKSELICSCTRVSFDGRLHVI